MSSCSSVTSGPCSEVLTTENVVKHFYSPHIPSAHSRVFEPGCRSSSRHRLRSGKWRLHPQNVCLICNSSGQEDRVCLLLIAPFWLAHIWFSHLDLVSLLEKPPWEARNVDTLGLAFEWGSVLRTGISSETVETILNARFPSTRRLYALKWRLLMSCCRACDLDPAYCPVGSVLEFLQEHFLQVRPWLTQGVCRSNRC